MGSVEGEYLTVEMWGNMDFTKYIFTKENYNFMISIYGF
jgi:hypothetical protein